MSRWTLAVTALALAVAASAWADDDLTELMQVLADDGEPEDAFGFVVAVDGDVAVVGAPLDDEGEDEDLEENVGAAYVFRKADDGTWEQEAKLVPEDAEADHWFGYAVAVSGDLILVGAVHADLVESEEETQEGAAYVFFNTGGEWVEEDKLVAVAGGEDDFEPFDTFGFSVAIDGDRALVGAPGKTDSGRERAGAAYAYERVPAKGKGGWTWIPDAKFVTTPDTPPGELGFTVSLSGGFALLGAPVEPEGQMIAAGAAYIVRRDPTEWVFEQRLVPSFQAMLDVFGRAVCINGAVAAVTAPVAEFPALFEGRAYVFRRDNDDPPWREEDEVFALNGAPGDSFGWSVALRGNVMIVSAPLQEITEEEKKKKEEIVYENAGIVHVYRLEGFWVHQEQICRPEEPQPFSQFGYAASLGGSDFLIGVPFEDVARDEKKKEVDENAGAGYFGTLVTESCPGDFDGSGDVGFEDVVQMLLRWGPCPGCQEDLDGDDLVGFTDLVQLLSLWGPCP